MSCKWCAMGQCWGCKQNPQQGQKRGGNFGGFGAPAAKRGNFGNNSEEAMMAGMMMAMMANMANMKGGGGGFRGNKQGKKPRQQQPQSQSDQPWKGALQQALKADGKDTPTYEKEKVSDNKWKAVVTIGGEQMEGTGKGPQNAEQAAARNALHQLYPEQHLEIHAQINANKKGPATDSKSMLHRGTQLFVRRQFDRNMTGDDIKYDAKLSGGKWTATVALPEGLEGPYAGQPDADRTKAEESAADTALAAAEDVFAELLRDAEAQREARQQERQARLAEQAEAGEQKKPMVGFAKLGGVKKETAQKKPMVGFAKLGGGVAKKETAQKKPSKLSISLNK